jgi:hypothetical protein
MIRRIFKLYHPSVFQGNLNKRTYFEGWYFKLISPNGERLAVIPGIALNRKDNQHTHAFIQVINGTTTKTHYFRFDIRDFSASNKQFQVRIDQNYFSDSEIRLNLSLGGNEITGHVSFKDLQPFPVSWHSPGIMGWYTFMPFMECYHGIVSMHHALDGRISLNQSAIDFSDGKGYIEKDWGRSFPKAWVWIQSNHFDLENDASLMVSVADIPWMGKFFIGFLCVLWIRGKYYRFATYTGARIHQLTYQNNRISLEISHKNLQLRITTGESKAGILKAPEIGKMDRIIKESLDALVSVSFTDLAKKSIIFKDTGRHAGFELAGDIHHLIENY